MTPREFTYALDGYRAREDHVWAKCATLIAHLGWHKEPTSPKQIFDRITGVGDERGFDRVAGFSSPDEDLDYFMKHQKKPGA